MILWQIGPIIAKYKSFELAKIKKPTTTGNKSGQEVPNGCPDTDKKGLFKDEELRPIPLLQTEVKQRLVKKQDSDAAEVIKHLADTDGIQSVAGRVYRDWRLDRRQIKDCHIAMKDDRRLQVTLNNIVAAIRFKTFGGQRLVRARCQKK